MLPNIKLDLEVLKNFEYDATATLWRKMPMKSWWDSGVPLSVEIEIMTQTYKL